MSKLKHLVSAIYVVMYSVMASAQAEYRVSAQQSVADGDHTPLWLNANKYGLSSLDTSNGYLRAGVFSPLSADSASRLAWGYGADVAVAYNNTSSFIVQQAYVEGRWLHGTLTVGSKEQPMELKNQLLSSGPQALGINARPIPQVRLALPDYWTIPGLGGWVALKGHFGYGMQTDDKWQKEFTHREQRYTEHTLYHSKASYFRIGKEDKPLSLELGLEMACQFGGRTFRPVGNGDMERVDSESGLSAFLDAIIPGGADANETLYRNSEGNTVGSWMLRLNLDFDSWYLGLYADHYFEDHSSMYFFGWDGYEAGNPDWDTRKSNRLIYYGIKDGMLGAELHLKKVKWADSFVLEFLTTKYQSGPVYHDHTYNIADQVSGYDHFYNHSLFTGWQHWGQVMGNPLYLSPLYNDNGQIYILDNRFTAWHLGIGGSPAPGLSYRLLATWQRGLGNYITPYDDPRHNTSLLAEATYRFPERSALGGWAVRGGVGTDRGQLLGHNTGFQLTVMKSGLIRNRK